MNLIQILADNNFGDTRSGGLAGPTGLFIIVVLAIVMVLLIRNMSKRIRRLPAEFPASGKGIGTATATADEAGPSSAKPETPAGQ